MPEFYARSGKSRLDHKKICRKQTSQIDTPDPEIGLSIRKGKFLIAGSDMAAGPFSAQVAVRVISSAVAWMEISMPASCASNSV